MLEVSCFEGEESISLYVCKRLLSQLCVCICWQQTAVYRRLLQWQYKMNFRERTDIILSARDIAFQQVGCRGGGSLFT